VTDIGKVGIGTASPGYTLDVAGDINTSGTYRMGGTDYGKFFINSAGTLGQIWTSSGGTGRGAWGSEVDGVIGNEILDVAPASGLVRSGTGTAASPFKVGINFTTDCSSEGKTLLYNGTTGVWSCGTDDGVTSTGSPAATQVAFWTGANTISGNSNLYWDNTNNRLGIGMSNPAYLLDVNGAVRLKSLYDSTSAAGLNGQVLTSNGTTVSWQAPAGSDADNGLHYDASAKKVRLGGSLVPGGNPTIIDMNGWPLTFTQNGGVFTITQNGGAFIINNTTTNPAPDNNNHQTRE